MTLPPSSPADALVGRRRDAVGGLTRWRAAALALVTGGGFVAIVGMFGPWIHSGAMTRSSFELADLVERLGFAPDGLIGTGLRSWPLAPLLVVIGVVPIWWWGGKAAAAAAVTAGAMVGVVGAAVWTVPDSRWYGSEWGSFVTALGALTMVVGGLVEFVGRATSARRRPSLGDLVVPESAALEDGS